MQKTTRSRGVTLLELMIVLTIAAVVTTLATIGISSRWRTSRLESTAQEMVSAMSSARTSAIYKNCPTRIVFCADAACTVTAMDATIVPEDSGNTLHVNGAPARYFAVLRQAYYGIANNQRPCWFNGNDPNDVGGTNQLIDGWDFDGKPIYIPNEIRIEPGLYQDLDQLNEAEWDVSGGSDDSGRTSNEATNSIWFATSTSGLPSTGNIEASVPANIPVDDREMEDNRFALIQIKLDNCDPSADEDCLGYIIAAGAGGDMEMVRCVKPASTRTNGTNECYGN